MTKRCAVLAAWLAILWAIPAAEADPRFHGRGTGGRSGGGSSVRAPGPSVHPHGNSGHRFGHRAFGPHRHFVPFATVIAPPVVFYSLPSVAYVPPPYYGYSPPPFYGAAVSSATVTVSPPAMHSAAAPAYPQPPSAPPAPRVVEFPTGRYELRGDGMSAPYTWVWIPNPPLAPPTAAPTPSPAPSGSGDVAAATRTQLYTWVDEQGVAHWTNRADKVRR